MESQRTVEVTSPDMTRFMMTIEDAVNLVLAAAHRSRGGELFILKMPSLRVIDLVEVFVEEYSSFRGWDPDDINVRITGVRPGEKMHEELVTEAERVRVEEFSDMFVVHPVALRRRVGAVLTPDSYCSNRMAGLDKEEIRTLLHRSGVLARIQERVLAPDVMEEPVL